SGTHTATIDWGDGVIDAGDLFQWRGSGTVSGTHTYQADGVYTVIVQVQDDGGSSQATLEVTAHVANQAPVVLADLPALISGGDDQRFAFAFTDANPDDGHAATVDWGDGSSLETVALANDLSGFGTAFPKHVYPAAGNFTLTVSVTDDRGAIG